MDVVLEIKQKTIWINRFSALFDSRALKKNQSMFNEMQINLSPLGNL